MKLAAAVGALLVVGASALGCNGLLGISIINGAAQEDAGDGPTPLADGGEDTGGPTRLADGGEDTGGPTRLLDGGGNDTGGDAGGDDAGDSGPACLLSALTASPGTLSPAFGPTLPRYTVTSSATSLGVPFTLTPTVSAGCSVKVNGTAVVSGEASSPIALGVKGPTAIDVTVMPMSGTGTTHHYALVVPAVQETPLKAFYGGLNASFGWVVALSSDGNTLAAGAPGESSAATGIDGNQSDTSASEAGAVYVFARTESTWTQQAYLKSSTTRAYAYFGYAVALSSDGDTLSVGAYGDSSAATGIDGNESDTSAGNAGAVYVFARTGTTWTQQAYVKASNTGVQGLFGTVVAMSSDGDMLAVGACSESSDATGIDGNGSDTSAANAGAAYVFTRTGTTWTQQAYIKASNTRANAYFGYAIALSSDGSTLTAGSPGESSAAPGVNGEEGDTSTSGAGAVYVFTRTGMTWTQQAYVKASNPRADADFGWAVALSSDGNTLAVGSPNESSAATGIDGNQSDTSTPADGAVYVFGRTAATWAQGAYVKASNALAGNFGSAVLLSSDGNTLAVGSPGESSAATGINGNQSDGSAPYSGAVYVFARPELTWAQQAYVKPSDTREGEQFGSALALSYDGTTLAVGATCSTSFGGSTAGCFSAASVGAIYVFQ